MQQVLDFTALKTRLRANIKRVKISLEQLEQQLAAVEKIENNANQLPLEEPKAKTPGKS